MTVDQVYTLPVQQGDNPAMITIGKQNTLNKYELLRSLARIAHANINIKGGNYFQDEIFKAIRDSEKHVNVTQEHPIPLRNPNKKRKHHHVDILVVDENMVTAINSKGKSFNNTKSEDSELSEYEWYIAALKEQYPGKEVRYIILKDEYDAADPRMNVYHYLNEKGVRVYNTEEYLYNRYDINFTDLERRRQERAVVECEKVFLEEGFDISKIYETAS